VLVRSVTTPEPRYTEQDTALLLALAEYRETLCDCCGIPKALTWSDRVHERDSPRFVVGHRFCRARRTLIESQQVLTKKGKEAKPEHGAIRWTVRAEMG
jgi:hypothetical protein